jgi:hypothetical protein
MTTTGESDEIGGASDETSRKDHRQTRVATSESVTRETGIEDYQTQASLVRSRADLREFRCFRKLGTALFG